MEYEEFNEVVDVGYAGHVARFRADWLRLTTVVMVVMVRARMKLLLKMVLPEPSRSGWIR